MKQNPDYRDNLTKDISDEFEEPTFIDRCRGGQKGVFTRRRSLTLKNLILTIVMFKTSIQRELDSFFKKLSDSDFNIRKVTKGAFTQSRAKLNPWAFIRLNEVAVNSFYNGDHYLVWYGMRTLSVDGTRLVLPNHPSIKEAFGEHRFGPKADSPQTLALASMLYDVHNSLVLDAQIAPLSSSERDLFEMHLDKTRKGDLLLADRGYPSIALMFLLKAKGVEFCMRMKDNWWLSVRGFNESDIKETIVKYKLPKKDKERLSEYPHMLDSEIECRLVKVELENGKTEILCTSLTDTKKYACEDFKELYHYRWNEEEAYKLLKNRIELEAFSGKTARAVKQDFHAKIFLLTLCAAYAYPIDEKVKKEYSADKDGKYSQKINRTNAISMTMDILPALFAKHKFKEAIKSFDEIVFKTREIIRPGRKVKRKKKPKKQYSMNYKRL